MALPDTAWIDYLRHTAGHPHHRGVDRRLRLAALVRKMPLSRFLDQVLDQALPQVGELAEQIQGRCPPMSTETTWAPFGIPDDEYRRRRRNVASGFLIVSWRRPRGTRRAHDTRTIREERDPAAQMAMVRPDRPGHARRRGRRGVVRRAVSLVYAAKGLPWAAALEAGIPDVGSAVFASLGIALALKGKRASVPAAATWHASR